VIAQETARKSAYTEFHPRWYRTHISTFWWLGRWHYLKFIIRELSSVFVAIFVVLTLFQIAALSRGAAHYANFERALRSPLMIAINFVALVFVIFHAVTWFNLAPKAIPVRLRGKRLPDWMVAAPNYVAWLAVSAAIAWIVLSR
jgi:fumarate reductase subunit C